jgi:hypothetical protein
LKDKIGSNASTPRSNEARGINLAKNSDESIYQQITPGTKIF